MASDHLASLGMFIFGMDGPGFNELQRRSDWKWGATERYGARDALQFTGPGEDKITIEGMLVPELAGLAGSASDLDRLREMAAQGEAWTLTLGNGTIVGEYVIAAVDDRQRNFVMGGMARMIDFAVDLIRFET